ncbi:MAG TPA: OmpA family protein [Vicinamibacterales bacterium]|nr:OmpA family protein [Vicinamibacterales bacterium]
MKKFVLVLPVLALTLGGSSACATKKFVKGQVGEVNDKVETMSKSLEETQERTRANEAKIAQVDQVAQAADKQAAEAGQAASTAQQSADKVNARADALEVASKRIVYEVVLSEDEGNFKFGQAALPKEAEAKLDELAQQLKANPNGAYIEIEGHTDSVGPKDVNYKIGLERANAVKKYLYEQQQIPLHKINVISYGEDKPIAPNKTKAGRAQNRRVVIKVLA